MRTDNINIAIVGAGVVGSTTARLLQAELRHANVTIIADGFRDETLSTVAAGIFRPGTSFKGPTPEITKKWVEDSWHYWNDLLKAPDATLAGIISNSSYIFSKKNQHVTRNHLFEDLVPVYRRVEDDELIAFGSQWKYGAYFETLKVECSAHLPWIEKYFLLKGGNIIKQKIESLASLSGKYDLVFNCTGLGAKYLCNDHDLVPIRGQIIRVRAPWLRTGFYGDYDAYIIPGLKGLVTLGGTRQYDSYNMDVCKHDAAGIMERCCELVPGLKAAEVVGHYVGLRPHRSPVRVEGELLKGLKVVHCYGHGGYGVTCAPGTAMHALKIAQDLLKTNVRNKL